MSPNFGSAGISGALSPPPPVRGLTALVGVAVLGRALVQGLLLSEMILVGFPVPAGTGTDPPLEGSPPQDLAAGRTEQSVVLLPLGKGTGTQSRQKPDQRPSGSSRAPQQLAPGEEALLGQRKAPAAGLGPRCLRASPFPSWQRGAFLCSELGLPHPVPWGCSLQGRAPSPALPRWEGCPSLLPQALTLSSPG